LKDIIAVYSSHPTAPLSLQARVSGFTPQKFSLLEKQSLAVRIPAMRESVYLLPQETAFRIRSAALPLPGDPYWQKRYSQKGRTIPEETYGSWKEQIKRAANNRLTASEIKAAGEIPDEILKPVLNRMAFKGELLRIGADSLRSNTIRYVTTEKWFPNDFMMPAPDESLGWLAGEYLRAYGPARIQDFQWWSGVTAGKAKTAMTAIDSVTLENDYLILQDDVQKFDQFTPLPIENIDILPQWDSYTMGYAPDGRKRFVDPDMQDRLYGKLGATGGNALGAVLINGLTQGVWSSRFKGDLMVILLNMFDKPNPLLCEDILRYFEPIAALLKAKRMIVEKNLP